MNQFGFQDEQIARYSRHIVLNELGAEGQRRLLDSRVLVIGAGGLGSPALLYLAAAGAGRLGVADHGNVDLPDLQRQILYAASEVGTSKVLSARETILRLNPDCSVRVYPYQVTEKNVGDLISQFDVVLDGSDNFPTRLLVADHCWNAHVPLVSAAVIRFEGQLMTILPGEGNPCYRCFLSEVADSELESGCSEAGVLGPAAGVMGALQAVEAIKLLLGIGTILSRHLLLYDAFHQEFRLLARNSVPGCHGCSSAAAVATSKAGMDSDPDGEPFATKPAGSRSGAADSDSG